MLASYARFMIVCVVDFCLDRFIMGSSLCTVDKDEQLSAVAISSFGNKTKAVLY
jgi:hypothetical protein